MSGAFLSPSFSLFLIRQDLFVPLFSKTDSPFFTRTNMLVMTLMGGQQISFVNLGSCSLDIALNALAIHLITKNDRSELNSSDHAIPIRPRHYAGVSISTELASVSDRHSTGQRYALSNRKSVNLEGILEGSKEIGSEESDAEKGVIEVVLPRK